MVINHVSKSWGRLPPFNRTDKAYMGQNLGHGNFHPEQYMGAAVAMAHIPASAFPQGPDWGVQG